MKPTLILVGADKGGVGKTTVSRILLDYFARKNVLTRAFDTENPRGSLKRFYPATTEINTNHHTLSLHDALPISRRAGIIIDNMILKMPESRRDDTKLCYLSAAI